MNITDYIDSKDIGDYLKKINYKFTSLEAIWIVYNSYMLSFDTRKQLWNNIINEFPDYILPDRYKTNKYSTIFEYITLYIQYCEELKEEFYNNDSNSIYYYYGEDKNGISISSKDRFKTFEDCLKDLNIIEDEFYKYSISKYYLDNNEIYATFLSNGELSNINTSKSISIDLDVLDNMCFNFPVPFKKGDILVKKYDYNNEPFVFESAPNETNFNLGYIDEDYMGSTDMILCGLYSYDNGTIYPDTIHQYMDVEYINNSLPVNKQTLESISNYYKGGDILKLLLEYHKAILNINKEKISYELKIRDYK